MRPCRPPSPSEPAPAELENFRSAGSLAIGMRMLPGITGGKEQPCANEALSPIGTKAKAIEETPSSRSPGSG